MFDICGFSKNTLTDCYSIFHSIVVFLLVTVHFFYLIFAEINYLNFLIAGGLLIFISSSTLLIFGFYCVLKKFLGWLKVKKTTKNQVFMIFLFWVTVVLELLQEYWFFGFMDRQSFECKICFNEYSENRLPRFLIGCDHTICQECAQKCFDLKHKKYITCPFCQMPTVIKGNVLILPTNLALMEVIDEVKKKT
ncbi:Protein CBG15689 [Caenorhabditis briggsae]|uniref:Protein CBG15689 n=1 Tax=Caenorhabditis briggsae TaxID=6238 RepID=A8XMJ4_CAEBR|nr:Protein CBG15689 [Caenorhabditis briggsae]CAP33870.2 Protein CBG15689 [Caenorhabditis briggsae]